MRKIFFINFLAILFIVICSGQVNAKFSASTASDELGSDEVYIEQLKTAEGGGYNNDVVQGPFIFEDDNESITIKDLTVGDVAWIHVYFEYFWLDVSGDEKATLVLDGDIHEKGMAKFQSMSGSLGNLTYDDDDNNSVEFMVMVRAYKSGDSKLRIRIVDDNYDVDADELDDETEFIFFIELKNVKKSDNEIYVEEIEDAYTDTSLLNISGKDTNTAAEDIAKYIKSDCKYNNGNNIKNWTKNELSDRISKLKLASNNDYKFIITNLQNILNETMTAEKENREKNQDIIDQSIGAISLETGKEISYLLSIVVGGDDGDRPDGEFWDVLKHTNKYEPIPSEEGLEELENKVNIVLTIITNIGMIVSVLMSAVIGVKYMLGSVEEKAEYKKDMIPYLIGAGLLFGISSVIKMLQGIGKTINS